MLSAIRHSIVTLVILLFLIVYAVLFALIFISKVLFVLLNASWFGLEF